MITARNLLNLKYQFRNIHEKELRTPSYVTQKLQMVYSITLYKITMECFSFIKFI